jgi:arylformamidase
MTDTQTAIYRGMDRATLDAAYNNTAAVADSAAWTEGWRQRSAVVRKRPDAKLGIAYGPRERQRIDYFPSGKAKAPLFVFIHGGYWVRNSIDMFSFLAEGPLAHGIDVAVIGYTLAPDATLAQIVEEIRAGLTFLQHNNAGYDRERIFVGGWSAGGHLAALTSDHVAVRGALPISGVFDLEPLSLNYLNDPLQLTPHDIATLSPIHTLRADLPPHRLFAGGGELSELQRQSRDFESAARSAGLDVTLTVLPGLHHYSILDELAKPDGKIALALAKLVAA